MQHLQKTGRGGQLWLTRNPTRTGARATFGRRGFSSTSDESRITDHEFSLPPLFNFQLSTVNLLCAASRRVTEHGSRDTACPCILRHQLIAHKRELPPIR